jgi:uncharacterized RDD family membrane protein YckC
MTDGDGTSYASLGRRLAAWLLDSAILLLILFLVFIAMRLLRAVGAWAPGVGAWAPRGVGEPVEPWELWKALGFHAKVLVIFAYVLSLGPVYFVLFESSPRQATFGKQLMNIYVTSDEGKRISSGRAVSRWVAKFVLTYFGLSLISLLTIAATKERKGLHDFTAKTLVKRGQLISGGALEPWRIVVAIGVPFVWMVGTFLATI